MYHRTPSPGSGFCTEWKHTSSLLVAKTVKDMIVQTSIADETYEWSYQKINEVFFKEQAVWL